MKQRSPLLRLLRSVTARKKLNGRRLFSSSSASPSQKPRAPPRGNDRTRTPHLHRLVDWVPPRPPPPLPQQQSSSATPSPNPSYSQNDFSTLCNLLREPSLRPGPCLEDALDRAGIEPEAGLVRTVFEQFDSSPKLLYALFLWAEKKPGFQSSATLLNSTVGALGKAREFDAAWCLILDRIGSAREGQALVSCETFAVLIRRYSRAGLPLPAIRTFEYASNLGFIGNSDDVKTTLFEILLDSLCKEGHVRVAAEYFERKKELDLNWVPPIRIYNILLNGWFRLRKLKRAERLWLDMRKESVRPSVVTYGTLVEGYCRMRRVERAIELVGEMREEGIEPNAIVYNPIIDAFAEAGRFKEASGMMEHFLQCESGPTVSTYNSLVKGYCKAGDLIGASKILKMMIGRGFLPTATTYNYLFRYFAKYRKTEEGMNLYTKMVESGYSPDRLTYHLLLKMLCEEERLDLAVQVSKEMRARGCDMDLATSTMLTHLLCKVHKLEEAFAEFKEMLRRGIVPQYLTFHRLNDELRKQGKTDMAEKLCNMMSSVPHPTNLPNTYNVDRDASQRARRRSILQKAETMSEILKTCNDPRKLVKHRSPSVNPVLTANLLIADIKKRVNEM